MPIPLTKYNKISALHLDLSTNSYIFNQYILTCDISDTLYIDNGTVISNKHYLESKASYLIHPFSNLRNCETKFNTIKDIYKYKKLDVPAINEPTSYDISATQKIIQNTVRVPSSLYSDNLAALHINSNNISTLPWNNASDRIIAHGSKTVATASSIKPNYGVDVKHNSYDRYLGRKKSQNLKADKQGSTPLLNAEKTTYFGNKTYKFSIVNCKKTC
jgi:hypothetical protein|tara:strand:+ start:506 stop:1156 length:651 start_codon:yes stop_codon:yes gene_type:complete